MKRNDDGRKLGRNRLFLNKETIRELAPGELGPADGERADGARAANELAAVIGTKPGMSEICC